MVWLRGPTSMVQFLKKSWRPSLGVNQMWMRRMIMHQEVTMLILYIYIYARQGQLWKKKEKKSLSILLSSSSLHQKKSSKFYYNCISLPSALAFLLPQHLICMSHRKTRWTISVDNVALKIFFWGPQTPWSLWQFFSPWYKTEVDPRRVQQPIIDFTGSWDGSLVHGVNNPWEVVTEPSSIYIDLITSRNYGYHKFSLYNFLLIVRNKYQTRDKWASYYGRRIIVDCNLTSNGTKGHFTLKLQGPWPMIYKWCDCLRNQRRFKFALH